MAENTEPTTEPTTTEEKPADEPLGAGGLKALREEREARRQLETELKQARETLTARERADVATTAGLPASLAERLQGSTREEMEADAERLLADLGPASAPEPFPLPRKPNAQLRGGSDPTRSHDPTPSQVADKILDRGY